ncbi:MAG: 4Fe-4S binding protein [Methanomicrobiales archaeon]|nr:4Fe-4S binding protein [Methanomicrobiales archaeon]
MDLKTFFTDVGIDVFAEVSIANLPDADRKSVVQMLPSARSVIVFGKAVPVQAYRMTSREQTRVMLRIARDLDNSAKLLARLLNMEGTPAFSVPLYLPVRVQDGRVHGVVRLKKVAEVGRLGSIGISSILLSPLYGPRLLLLGVVTNLSVSEHELSGEIHASTGTPGPGLCSGCGRCVTVCPGGAVGPDGVEWFRCRTIRTWVPPSFVPAVKWLLGLQMLLKFATPFAPWIARMASVRCSLCVTQCPLFEGVEGT